MAIAMGITPALSQNVGYAHGDLVLFFQKEGNTNTIYANLGNAALLYRGAAAGVDVANKVGFLNINSALTAAFGSGWASDVKIYAGLAGVWGTSNTSSILQDGDPHRTLYVSARRDAVGTVGQPNSAQWIILGNTQQTSGSTGIYAQNNKLETFYTSAVVVSPTSDSFIDDQNPFLEAGIQNPAFSGAFEGGVQQKGTEGSFGNFGGAGAVEFALDLYRILGKTGVAGQVPGVLREGSYEGTVTLNSSGQVSFITQGSTPPPSSFQTWALTFPALDTEAKRLPTADPDSDGLTNQMEFVLNGNPGVSDSPPILPTLNAAGTDFVFTFKRRDDSEANNTLVFQYGINLMDWTNVAVGASGGTVGGATVGIVENSTSPDSITLTVPKSVAPGGKLFGRLKTTQP